MKLYNSLTKKVEEFAPIHPSGWGHPPKVGLYTCGPTVYDYPTIGNWRTYTTSDLLIRVLQTLAYDVRFIMNITDVGHLTGDNAGDADIGEDRLEKAAARERKTAWEIADYYTTDFLKGFGKLNFMKPLIFAKATEHLPEQIALIQKIQEKGYAYRIADGIYFDVRLYERNGNTYGVLSTLDKIKEGARVEKNPEKRDPRDFALWKFSPADKKRDMEWESPWGKGYPGWHIECSAMSMKYLGGQFDIHAGGDDLKSIHHPNEIAQSEAATGKKPFARFWVHGAFLKVDNQRMGKSLGNAYTLDDLEKKGFSPLDLRYFYLTAHYRSIQNFTFEGLDAAKTSREKLVGIMAELFCNRSREGSRTMLSDEKLQKVNQYGEKFYSAVKDDLNMPEALAVVWEVVKSNIPSSDKLELLTDFDAILGLNLIKEAHKLSRIKDAIPQDILKLVEKRDLLRKQNDWAASDVVRGRIVDAGYNIEDTKNGTVVKKR